MKLLKRFMKNKIAFFAFVLWMSLPFRLYPARDTILPAAISQQVEQLMQKGDIPGLSLVMIKGNKTLITTFGYADLKKKTDVTPQTLFEIGSCSKAFTAFAVLRLEQEGLIRLDDPVSKYIPWFYMTYKNKKCEISINQLLHHTSGIPFKSISGIPQDSSAAALEHTVKSVCGTELNDLPGKKHEYATINYDIAGLIIQQVKGISFEQYLGEKIFPACGMEHTFVGKQYNRPAATGYRISFFKAQEYDAPVFRGNNPAGYVISNAEDMAQWLRIQIGITGDSLQPLVLRSHIADRSVAPFDNQSYAYGWMVDPYGKMKVAHGGYNPNFTAQVTFLPEEKTGVIVLANSNSLYTPVIANYILSLLSEMPEEDLSEPADKVDVICSILCIILSAFILLMLGFIMYRIVRTVRAGKQAESKKTGMRKALKIVQVLLIGLPYFYGIYLIPEALTGFSWTSIFVWTPYSFTFFIYLLLAAIAVTYLFYFSLVAFPGKSAYRNSIPLVLFLSVLSGLANTAVLFIITSSFYSNVSLPYLIYYFILAYGLYVIGIKVSQTRLIGFTNGITFDIRMFLINKIRGTRFQDFEKFPDGRILTILSNDTAVLAGSANLFIGLIANGITIFSAFLYMATISFGSTLVMLSVVFVLAWYYYMTSKKAMRYIDISRESANEYMGQLNSMIFGFKELSIHRFMKVEFINELVAICRKFRDNNIRSSVKFLNSGIIGNSFIMIVLGVLSIIMPRVSSAMNILTIISFVMVVLYIIGPINSVLAAIPETASIKVSWNRISLFLNELDPASKQNVSFWEIINYVRPAADENDQVLTENTVPSKIARLEVEALTFNYSAVQQQEREGGPFDTFKLGPVNFSAEEGEILFVIGGNGSGKSTLAGLLTGLYLSHNGSVKINGRETGSDGLGEYFSVVYSNGHLFKKLYGIPTHGREKEIEALIKKLRLDGKVTITENTFSTTDLSSGQKKRLALLKCLLEDRPVYLFDELAADQDPDFRKFFYRELLPEMKKNGKIIIAITHDDHYFDVADKVLKLDYGSIGFISDKKAVTDLPVLL